MPVNSRVKTVARHSLFSQLIGVHFLSVCVIGDIRSSSSIDLESVGASVRSFFTPY